MSKAVPVSKYLDAIRRDVLAGNSTEHTHRPALKSLIEALHPDLVATNEPRRVSCGAPDFVISRSAAHGPLTIGYIEAKDVGTSLDALERSEQGRRYLNALENIVFTDYLTFRWYVRGQPRAEAKLTKDALTDFVPTAVGPSDVTRLFDGFVAQEPAPITQPQDLAERMARTTHLIRDVIVETFQAREASQTLRDLRQAFSEVLIPHIEVAPFADMFAQTLAYGLFAARANHDEVTPFRRQDAAWEIPRTNPFLQKLFATITGPDLDNEPFIGFADDLAQLLARTDMQAVLANFGARTRRRDPIVHFYETFLASYDPGLREKRGVYFTPEPVVAYIVNSVDGLLRERFGRRDGLAQTTGNSDAPPVLVLDPAVGTGTFLYAAVDLMRERFMERGDAGKWSGFVKNHVLPKLFGFELLMAPYAVAHLKLGLQMAGMDLPPEQRCHWHYDFGSEERLGVYLTNTLEEAAHKSELLLGSYISEEANAAAGIKRDLPIMVVIGNPPYSGHSENRGDWITDLVADYKRGVPGLDRPGQAKWLQDDYVKFIRFGEWRISQTGVGILGYITNHGYLDNPTFRGMRRHLIETFSDIYVLNLHGNRQKARHGPDGTQDRNVFDIEQGVAISLFVKSAECQGPATVHYAELWGGRSGKYEWLESHDLSSTEWQVLKPREPFHLFVPQGEELVPEYEEGWRIADIFSLEGDPPPAMVTTHDQFAISWTAAEAADKVERLLATGSEDEARVLWRLCSTTQWSYEAAKTALRSEDWRADIEPVAYRPFDRRFTVFNPHVAVHRRLRVMRHMRESDNLALVVPRRIGGGAWSHAMVSDAVTDDSYVSNRSSERGFVFPLYLEPAENELFAGPATRVPNLNPALISEMEAKLGLTFVLDRANNSEHTFGAEDVFDYLYAVLSAPSYRQRFEEYFRSDFPRVPITDDVRQFRKLAAVGSNLVALHLLRDERLAESITNYPLPGNNCVAAGHPRYLAEGAPDPLTGEPIDAGRVYINPPDPATAQGGQCFRGVSEAVWQFEIGAYQVCEKWLKDRRRKVLRPEDIAEYERIVVAINATLGSWPSWMH